MTPDALGVLDLSTLSLAALILAAFVAGWVDAVVGGGGLIQLPALLIGLPSNTPPAMILGTNKISSFCGTATSSLTYALRIPLDWRTVASLTFEEADHALYPALGLAYEALRGPAGTSAVLNAANEEAVAAFLSGTIRFDRIHKVNSRTMAAVIPEAGAADSLEALLALDAEARRHAVRLLSAFVE